jgi:hypothetical protein
MGMLTKRRIHFPSGTEWDGARFYATQNGTQFKTHRLSTSGISHLYDQTMVDQMQLKPQDAKPQIKRDYCF